MTQKKLGDGALGSDGAIEVKSDKNYFNVRKYQNENLTLVDGSDALANLRGLVISFQHVPSGRQVYFKAFITSFNETYSSNFTPNEAFGRTDPIYQYKNTTRKITLAFKAPAASESEAFENLGKISALEQMLYPSYSEVDSATTLAQAPLIRIKVMNLLSKTYGFGAPSTYEIESLTGGGVSPRDVLYNSYTSGGDQAASGLLGVIESLSVNHNLEGDDGVFFKRQEQEGVAVPVRNTILPKFIDVNLSFAPIHEHTLGWKDGKSMENTSTFPYGITSDDTATGETEGIIATYDEQQEKAKAAAQERQLRQQRIDDATAKYSGLLGGLNTRRQNRQVNRTLEGYEKPAEQSARAAELQERMQARLGVLNSIDEFIE